MTPVDRSANLYAAVFRGDFPYLAGRRNHIKSCSSKKLRNQSQLAEQCYAGSNANFLQLQFLGEFDSLLDTGPSSIADCNHLARRQVYVDIIRRGILSLCPLKYVAESRGGTPGWYAFRVIASAFYLSAGTAHYYALFFYHFGYLLI